MLALIVVRKPPANRSTRCTLTHPQICRGLRIAAVRRGTLVFVCSKMSVGPTRRVSDQSVDLPQPAPLTPPFPPMQPESENTSGTGRFVDTTLHINATINSTRVSVDPATGIATNALESTAEGTSTRPRPG